MIMKYTPVIGLEIHAELLTKSKMFCRCENIFGKTPNSQVCPVCSGMPGTLPVINKNAFKLAVKAGLAVNANINNFSTFDRKNYCYPDLPKAYQITQLENPICLGGYITLTNGKNIRINNIHIEEDAGKLTHITEKNISLVDYNRCGVPLIEIVTEPDFSNADEVVEFSKELSLMLKYCGICDSKMEQGSLRVDVNISVMPVGTKKLGTRAEIKNLSSFRSITRAIEYEIKRQSELLEKGDEVARETRRYEENTGKTLSMRTKEKLQDYRYFPEPDLLSVHISDEEIDKIKSEMPELPRERLVRYIKEYNLSIDDARLIVSDKDFSDFYDSVVLMYEKLNRSNNPALFKNKKGGVGYKQIAMLMLVELNRCLNKSGKKISEISISPSDLAELANMLEENKISSGSAKSILRIMFYDGGSPIEIAKENGLLLNNNIEEIENGIDEILKYNIDKIDEYRNGNNKIFGYLMGECVRKLGSGANPQLIRDCLTKKLQKSIDIIEK